MTEAEQRLAVVREARTWIGTPWHHGADIKGAGVDCGMLLVRVFVDAGIVPPFDPRPYPPDWFLHQENEIYLRCMEGRARLLPDSAIPGAGDLVLWQIGRAFGHAAIVTDWPNAVHAYAPARRVVEGSITMKGRFTDPKYRRAFYSCWA
jgi:cell wall-associated NlpC family hydrolase